VSSKPAIVVVVEDDTSASFLLAELHERYARDYSIRALVPADALDGLTRMARDGEPVALVLARQGADGADLLGAAHRLYPRAKRGLLVTWGESPAEREDVVLALVKGRADYWVVEPTTSPDERFHRAITEFLDEWWRLRGSVYEAVRVIGDERSARTHEICDLLYRHDFPYGLYAIDSPEGRALLAEVGVSSDRGPVVVMPDGRALVDPSNVEVADAVGARTRPEPGLYDLVVVGGGPAGLAAAVTAASEGLRTALVEEIALGGQAGTSSLIRNYLGFPRGISGAELAGRAVDQAILFGADLVYGGAATELGTEGGNRVVRLSDGTTITARAVVIATGVSYRTLDVPALEPFNSVGVFYGAATSEARMLAQEIVYVVGGGNSAGQAAVHLANFASRVTILVRSDSVAESMSEYLVKDIDATSNIAVRYCTEVVDGGGEGSLEWLRLADRVTGDMETVPAAALFVLIGAEPFTGWLPATVLRDEWGYVLTGTQCAGQSSWDTESAPDAPAPRASMLFETSVPGVFAVGDVRRGSVKRVASAAGEGSIVVRLVHEYLGETATRPT
jgi:thioredoxin reductase (NADPH)